MWLIIIFGLGVIFLLCRAKFGHKNNKVSGGRGHILGARYGEEIDTPQRRKELMKWNEKHSDYLYEGPANETPALRSLRLSLLTPEQLAKIPFKKRIALRNIKRHAFFVSTASSDSCHICGKSSCHVLCDECAQRYKADLANGWEKTIPSVFRTSPDGKRQLWILQQCIAIDLSDEVITETIAKAEMREVVEIVHREIAEMERQDLERRADIQKRKNQQSELSDIVKRLS